MGDLLWCSFLHYVRVGKNNRTVKVACFLNQPELEFHYSGLAARWGHSSTSKHQVDKIDEPKNMAFDCGWYSITSNIFETTAKHCFVVVALACGAKMWGFHSQMQPLSVADGAGLLVFATCCCRCWFQHFAAAAAVSCGKSDGVATCAALLHMLHKDAKMHVQANEQYF